MGFPWRVPCRRSAGSPASDGVTGQADLGALWRVGPDHRWTRYFYVAIWCRPNFASARRWRDANSLRSQGESILFLAPDNGVRWGNKISKWSSTRVLLVSSCRTRRSHSRVVVTPHFWPTAEGQVLLQNGQNSWKRALRCLVRCAPAIRIDRRLRAKPSALGAA